MTALTQNDQELLAAIRQLKLHGMAAAIENQLSNEFAYSNVDFTERLMEAVQAQQDYARQRSYDNAIKKANLPWDTTLEKFSTFKNRGIPMQEYHSLAALEWVKAPVNLIIIGKSGSGKSSLGSAIAENAIRNGCSAAFWKTHDLLDTLVSFTDHKSYERMMKRLSKTQVLVLDDFLNGAVTRQRVDALYNVLVSRGKLPVVVCSQIRPEGFRALLIAGAESRGSKNDLPMAAIDSIADRLTHPAHLIEITGGSMRELEDNRIA